MCHGGSGLANTTQTIQELEPNANVYLDGLSISRNDVTTSDQDTIDWIRSLPLE